MGGLGTCSCVWRLAAGASAWGRAGGRLDIRFAWHLWKRKNLLSQWTSALCNGFCFSCVIAVNSRGWRASSLDTWPHLRFCIFPASTLYFIKKKAERSIFTSGGAKWIFFHLFLLPLDSWLSWSTSQPLCPRVLSPEVSSAPWGNRVAGRNRAVSASQPAQCRQLVPCGCVRGMGTCPRVVWLPSQIWVCPRTYTVVAFWTQMCDGNKLIGSANSWWRTSRLYRAFLLPLLSGRQQKFPYNCISFWQTQQLPPCSVLARCISLPLTYLSSSFSKIILLREPYLDTLGCLKLPSNDSVWESGSTWGTQCSLNGFCVPATVLGWFYLQSPAVAGSPTSCTWWLVFGKIPWNLLLWQKILNSLRYWGNFTTVKCFYLLA